MRLRTLLMGVVALVFGISAAWSVYLLGSPGSKAADVPTKSVVVLATDVQRGASLTAEMIRLEAWPADFVPEGALTRLEDAVDRTVWIPFVAGEPVLDEKLAAKGAGRGMAALIPPGYRAVTIQTPDVSTGVAGFIMPGNKVDVLLTLGHGGTNDPMGGGGTITFLQNIEILAVDQRIDAPSENVVDPKELRSVTLLVTPDDAARLDLGQNKGTLSLALRNPEDTSVEAISTATLTELRGGHFTIRAAPELARQVAALPPDEEFSLLPDAPTEAEQPAAAPSPSPAPPPEVKISRIRTLRGTSSGAVYLRKGVPVEPGSSEWISRDSTELDTSEPL